MGRKALLLKGLMGLGKVKQIGEAKDRITVLLSKADKIRYAYICEMNGRNMSNDLEKYIKKVISREKKNIPEEMDKKIKEAIRKELKSKQNNA